MAQLNLVLIRLDCLLLLRYVFTQVALGLGFCCMSYTSLRTSLIVLNAAALAGRTLSQALPQLWVSERTSFKEVFQLAETCMYLMYSFQQLD